MSYGISAKSSVEVRAAAAAFRLAPKEIKGIVTTDTKGAFKADWQHDVRAAAARGEHGTERSRLLRTGGSVNIIGTQPIKLAAYKSGKLRGGLKSKDQGAAFEFGTDTPEVYRERKTHSPKGTPYTVRRRTKRQLPARRSEGYSVYPTAAGFIPRIVSYWVQSIMKAYYVEFERRGL
jgi:hypothetical protein